MSTFPSTRGWAYHRHVSGSGEGGRGRGWLIDDRASVATEYIIVVSVLVIGMLSALPIVLAAVRRHYLTVVDWTALPFP